MKSNEQKHRSVTQFRRIKDCVKVGRGLWWVRASILTALMTYKYDGDRLSSSSSSSELTVTHAYIRITSTGVDTTVVAITHWCPFLMKSNEEKEN